MSQPAPIKEEEIRPDELFSEFVRLSIEDAENFFTADEMEHVKCPGCGADKHSKDSFTKHSFHYAHCEDCSSIYVCPRPSKSALLRYYATSPSQRFWADTILAQTGESRKKQIMLPAMERAAELLESTGIKAQSIIDVGAANGAFLQAWHDRFPNMKRFGIEPGELAASNCRKNGIEVFEGFVEDENIRQNASGDVITCFEVFEHVQDPKLFAKSICDVTAPGGCAILSCLGADGFDIQILWEEARAISPPYHLNFISEEGIKKIFTDAGFTNVEILSPGRLDVEIVERSITRGANPTLSRFEKLLLSKGPETLKAFQKFLAENRLSSHVWIVARKAA